MSSKEIPDLITTFHHSLLNLSSNMLKPKLLIKKQINDWDGGHTKKI